MWRKRDHGRTGGTTRGLRGRMVGGWVESCLGRGIVDAEGHVALRLLEVKQMGNLDVIDGGGS